MNNIIEMKTRLKDKVIKEVTEDILPYWMKHTIDNENGGFYGELLNDNIVNTNEPKGAILCARILWTYSTAYKIFGEKKYLDTATRAYEYLLKYFWDTEFSGFYWSVDFKGTPLDDKKQVYAEAFTIYALSEYYGITKNEESLVKAIEVFNLLEKYSYDSKDKGYFEAYTKDWKLKEDLRLSDKDMNEKKSMNTHLHVMEGYTNLLRVWNNAELRKKQRELIEITIEHIIDKDTNHFKLFFDEDWTSKSAMVSYGHDIEGSWLLLEAAEVLGEEDLIVKVKEIAIKMAQAVLDEGLDVDGSVFNEGKDNKIIDTDKHWWPQAEAVVGFYNAYELTGEEEFLKEAYAAWEFIENHLIDKENGEWFWKVSASGEVDNTLPKAGFWKCPYHNSRACFEIMERINKQISK